MQHLLFKNTIKIKKKFNNQLLKFNQFIKVIDKEENTINLNINKLKLLQKFNLFIEEKKQE